MHYRKLSNRKLRKLIDFITLGCSKNLVDSEWLMGLFEQRGFHCTHDAKRPQADIVVINTCGFIEDAKQESIDTILAFAQRKDEGRIRLLYVMGCLSQRYRKELAREIPQVDGWYGKFDFRQLLVDLEAAAPSTAPSLPPPEGGEDQTGSAVATPPPSGGGWEGAPRPTSTFLLNNHIINIKRIDYEKDDFSDNSIADCLVLMRQH